MFRTITRSACTMPARGPVSLGTPNQRGDRRLREWFVFLSANGWPAFLAKYRSSPAQLRPASSSLSPLKAASVTVGDFNTAVRNESDLEHKTFDDYARCLRFIISEIRTITKHKSRHDYRNGGRKTWLKAVDAMPLDEQTLIKFTLPGNGPISPGQAITNLLSAATQSVAIRICAGLRRCSVSAKF